MGQTWNGDVGHDIGNIASDIGSWLSGPPGDPDRIRHCAQQVESLRDRFSADHRGLNESIDELTRTWQGDGAASFRAIWYGGATRQAPDAVLTDAHNKLDRFAKQLYDYADQLQHAQDEHWMQIGIMAALTVVNAVQLGADPATDAAEVGVAAGTAVGSSFALADIGTMAIDNAVFGFTTDLVSQVGADVLDHLNPEFDRTGDHVVALFDPKEAATTTVLAGGAGLVLGGGSALLTALRSSAGGAVAEISDSVALQGLDPAGDGIAPGAQSNFMAPGEQFAANAAKTEPLEGYHDVIVHGSPTEFAASPQGPTFGPKNLASLIQGDTGYSGGPVRLLSCSTGADGATAAQEVSNELGVEVRAPSDTLWATGTGELIIGPTPRTPTGEWRSFFPQVSP